jgi:hypothetical protein
VQYAREFLVSTGTYTGDVPFAVGTVLELSGVESSMVALVSWDRPGLPERVNTWNLVRVDRKHLESNPPLNQAEDIKNRRLVGFLMRLPNVKAAEAGRMGTGEFFYEIEDNEGKVFRHKYETQEKLIEGVGMFVRGIERSNPPLEILSDKLDGKLRVLHYRVTIPMKGPKDAEKILQTLYPAWRVVAHYSLRSDAYPGIAHAYGVQMKLKSGKNPPDFMYQHIVAAYGHVLPEAAPGEWMSASEFATYIRHHYDLKEPRNQAAYDFLEANTSLHFRKERGGKIRVKRIHDNPPLPASALMDISTAKTVAREVEEGARELGSLGTVDHLLDRGLQKLRGSHLGQVDWKNPGPGKITRYTKRTQPLSRHNVVKAIEQLIEANVEVGELLARFKRRGMVSDGEYLEWKYVQQIAMMLRDDLTLATGSDLTNPPTATEIYKDIVEIKAIKPNGQRYVHKFKPGSNIYGLPNGNILIQSRKGRRLWKNFKMEG